MKASTALATTMKKLIPFRKHTPSTNACTEVFISRRQGPVGGFIAVPLPEDAAPEFIEMTIQMLPDICAEAERNRQRRLQKAV